MKEEERTARNMLELEKERSDINEKKRMHRAQTPKNAAYLEYINKEISKYMGEGNR